MTNKKVSAVTKYDHIWTTEQATIAPGLVLSFPLFVKNDLRLARQEEVRKNGEGPVVEALPGFCSMKHL